MNNHNSSTLQLTEDLVKIKSPNAFHTYRADDGSYAGIGCENEIQIFLENFLIQNGFRVVRQVVEMQRRIMVQGEMVEIPARFNLLAEKGEGAEAVLFFGHTDTVDVKLGWQSDPFQLTQREGEPDWKYYGLGANDMKGGIAAMLMGIVKAEIPKDLKIKVALLVDEEFWSYGANTMIKSDFLRDVKCAFVSEIADEVVNPGQIWIGLGRLGRTEFEIEIFGKSCHGADSAIANLSINAVHESVYLQNALLSRYLTKSVAYHDKNIEICSSQYISSIEGGKAVLSVPEYAKFTIDKSFIPGEIVDTQIKEIGDIIKELKDSSVLNSDTRIEIKERERPTPPCKPYAVKLESEVVKKLVLCLEELDIVPKFGIGRSVADENRVAEAGIPTLILSPNGQGSHTNEEWVDGRSLVQLEKIYKNLLEKW